MLTLVKNGQIYSPENLGRKDLLLAAEKIIAIEDRIEPLVGVPNVEIMDAAGKLIVPGFIDSHVHILGGGGRAATIPGHQRSG